MPFWPPKSKNIKEYQGKMKSSFTEETGIKGLDSIFLDVLYTQTHIFKTKK